MVNKPSFIITFVVLCTFLISCNNITKRERFNQQTWNEYQGFDGPDRDGMAEDLINTHRLIGLSNKEMLQLLGSPANYADTTKTYYELSQEFDSIDPISGKNLVITFNKDSIIVDAKIEDWRKH